MWGWLCEACRGLWEQSPVGKDALAGVSVTALRATMVNVDADGAPIRPAIIWLDQRRTEGLPPVGGAWGLAFTGFPYAIALRTGNPAAVNSSFILFFPFAFLTTTFLPQDALSGWLATVADYNPVTYLLAGLRALISTGWTGDILPALLAVGLVGLVSFGLAFSALRARVRRS